MSDPQTRIVVALPAEARPINRRFGLIRDNAIRELPLYRKGNLTLVVSGVGIEAAHTAVCGLQAGPNPVITAWINVGIAGHPTRPIGQAVLASEIVNQETGALWQTSLPHSLPCDSERLISCRRPEARFQAAALYDMEAAGFYSAAISFPSAKHIFCLKIVSDNRAQSSRGIAAKQVSALVQRQLRILEWLLDSSNG